MASPKAPAASRTLTPSTNPIDVRVSASAPARTAIGITWVIFFVVWYVIGIPLGPGYPVES